MLNRKKGLFFVIPLFMTLMISAGFNPDAYAESKEDELYLVAQKAFEDGFHDVAIRFIQQFLDQYPESDKRVPAQLLLGQCHFFKKQYLKAYDIFQGLTAYSSFKDATLFWLAETYFKGSDYKEAKKLYNQVIQLYPESIYVPQATYSLAWTYFEQGDYLTAKSRFLHLVKKYPIHPLSEDAAFKIGECEYNLGSYDIASQYFKNYVIRFPQSTRHAEAYFYIAEAYYYEKNYLAAVTYYAKAADIAYDAKITYMSKVSLGWSYLKLGKFDLSQQYFKEALQLAENKSILSDDIYLGQASLYMEMGNNIEALNVYDKLIMEFPNSPRLLDARLGKANIYYTLKDYPLAIQEYQGILSLADNGQHQDMIEKATYGLAWTYLKSGEPDLSIKSFESIMNKTQSDVVKVSALTQIGDAYQDSDQFEKAIEIYDRILKDYTESIYTDYVQFRQGVALLKLNRIDAATLSFLSLQTNFPTSKYLADVKYYLGVGHFKKEEWVQAIHHSQAYLDAPSPAKSLASEAQYIIALSQFNLGNYENSLQVFRDLMNSYPDQAGILRDAEVNIAKCLYELGQTDEAILEFKRIYTSFPQSEAAQDSLIKLGNHYLEHNEYVNAILYFEKFLSRFPGSDKTSLVLFELGQAHETLGQLDKAIQYYRRIESIADQEIYAKAQLAIADIFSEDVHPDTAVEAYQSIIKTIPKFKRDAYVKIARIYVNNKQFDRAADAYQKALSSEQALSGLRSAEVQFHLADTFELRNNPEEAVEEYLKIPYIYPHETLWNIKAYLRIARIFEDAEKWEEAKITYKKILKYQAEESKYARERIDWLNTKVSP